MGNIIHLTMNEGATRNRVSKSCNADREKIAKLLAGKKKELLTPDGIVEVYDLLGDTRLTAFVTGVTEETVAQAISGDIVPEGMYFTATYLSEITGVCKPHMRKVVKKFIPEIGNGMVIDRDAAVTILDDMKLDLSETHYEIFTASEKLEYGKEAVAILFETLGVPVTRAGRSGQRWYKKEIVDAIHDSWVRGASKDVVKYSGLKVSIRYLLQISSQSFPYLPRTWRDLADEALSYDMPITQKASILSWGIRQKNSQLLTEIKKVINENK
jgi:hypothetical protein